MQYVHMVRNASAAASLNIEDGGEASMVCGMRLPLSAAAMLTLLINQRGAGALAGIVWFIFIGYTLHSVVLYARSQRDRSSRPGKAVYWLDVLWFALMVYFAGGNNGFFFLFFFFAILISSFQWGFDEGARITLASTALFATTAWRDNTMSEPANLLLRATFLLALGYMIAYWGGLGVAQKRRMALLRDVSQLSNPRFGVDHTIASVLEQTRAFFNAGSCILLMRDAESDAWSLRTALAGQGGRPLHVERIGAAAAAPLLAYGPEQIVVYARTLWPRCFRSRAAAPPGRGHVTREYGDEAGAGLAELLEARSFISAPLALRNGEGRIFLTSARHGFSEADALFLSRIGAQAFPVIENIELLDRLASSAALRERQKIARDLHDGAIQPYIGLRHGLSALRNAATADNPLAGDLDKLIDMSALVIGEMRQFTSTLKDRQRSEEPELVVALRQQSAQFKEFYGIEIEVGTAGDLDVSDRLAAEVFQLVKEGMSNIRKHTSARRGCVNLARSGRRLAITIENEGGTARVAAFTPSSIAERAAALGGLAHVAQAAGGGTAVHVVIPV